MTDTYGRHDPATGCAWLFILGLAAAIVVAFALGFIVRGLV